MRRPKCNVTSERQTFEELFKVILFYYQSFYQKTAEWKQGKDAMSLD